MKKYFFEKINWDVEVIYAIHTRSDAVQITCGFMEEKFGINCSKKKVMEVKFIKTVQVGAPTN